MDELLPQWRCVNCKHVTSGHLKPDRCPSCRWCVGLAEVAATPPAPVEKDVELVKEALSEIRMTAGFQRLFDPSKEVDEALAGIIRATNRALEALSTLTPARAEGFRAALKKTAMRYPEAMDALGFLTTASGLLATSPNEEQMQWAESALGDNDHD